jgi:hypothetical protein
MCVTVTVVIGHFVALSRRSYLFSTMSSLHDVLVHDTLKAQGVFLSKNAPNLPFLAQEAQTILFSLFCTFNRRILY